MRAYRKWLRCRRGAFGIDAAIIIAFFFGVVTVLTFAGPTFISWLADSLLGGADGFYSYLIELPVLGTSGSRLTQKVGVVADAIYGKMQTISLLMFSIVLIVAAICYLLENFHIMSEGTASNIIMNSVFTFILIFAAKYLYNLIAVIINMFTGWREIGGTGYIITGSHEISALILSLSGGGPWELTDIVVRFFGSIIIFMLSVSILFVCLAMGAVRVLLVSCLAGVLPLLLVLRLIPPLRRIADSLIETLIGIMFASVFAAIFVHYGFMLIAPVNLGGAGITGVAAMVLSLAVVAACTYMATMFAGRLGSLFSSVATMTSAATAVATNLAFSLPAFGGGLAGGAVGGVLKARAAGLPFFFQHLRLVLKLDSEEQLLVA
ncbi:MAG: hypothetical protein QW445_07585 [Candidatus Bathyarchaeia archaeon]